MFRVRRSGPSEHSNVRLEGCVAELDPASFGGEAPLPSGAFGCSTSKPPFPLVGDRKQIPRPWSAGRLQLPVRPLASSFRVLLPTLLRQPKNPPLPSGTSEKMVAAAAAAEPPRHFGGRIRPVSMRWAPRWQQAFFVLGDGRCCRGQWC